MIRLENPNFELEALETKKRMEEEKIAKDWEASRQNEVVSRLLAGEDLQKIMETFPGFKESFRDLDTIDCSDGRVLDGKKIGIAGSGLLLSPEERAKFIENYKGKIKEVTTHRDCGAAALKFNSLKPEEIPEGVMSADHYGTLLGKQLANELGATHRFLEIKEMASKNHNEVGLVLDQTGRFDSTNLESFPPHFVCTGAGLGFSSEYMKSEIETLTGIALGHHGYGSRFTAENPFYIMVVAKNGEDQANWIAVAKEAADKFGDKVKIESFLSPESQN
jgi:hypothetical protein